LRPGQLIHKIGNKGFTLVELIVAALVVSVALFAILAMVRKGQEQIALDKHRREARGIIERTLETQQFQPESYNNLVTNTSPTAVTIPIATNISGYLTVAISAEIPAAGSVPPYRSITANVRWRELGSSVDETVSIVKWLANVQRK
jgi:prepilin-type N-terminal cleavage/methylation domain-containing protein